MQRLIHQVRRAAVPPDGSAASDGQLLERFLARHDPQAFEALVRRHGPMVFGVCRRVTGHVQDAEDAFQAVFLVLARKADSVRPREMVGNWLYGVACRSALEARTRAGRLQRRERPLLDMPDTTPSDGGVADHAELRAILDDALRQLPDKLRSAVVLCELEGRSRQEVAQQLGIPEGTLSSRLAAARKRLAARLKQRGVALPAAGLAALAAPTVASASLLANTIHAGLGVAAGQAAAGLVSNHVLVLAENVMKCMLISKWTGIAMVAIVVSLLGLGSWGAFVVWGGDSSLQGPDQAAAAQQKVETEDLKRMQGEWLLVRGVKKGVELSEAERKKQKFVFRGSVMQIDNGGPKLQTIPFTLKENETPKEFDIKRGEGHYKGIYQFDENSLKLCWSEEGPRPTEFASPEGSDKHMLVLARPRMPQNQVSAPQSARIYVGHDGGFASVLPNGGDWNVVLAAPKNEMVLPMALAISPDGKRMAYLKMPEKAIVEAKKQGGRPDFRFTVFLKSLHTRTPDKDLGVTGAYLRWTPDGKQLLVIDPPSLDVTVAKPTDPIAFWLVRPENGEKTALKLPDGHFPVEFSPDGEWLLTNQQTDKGKGQILARVSKDCSRVEPLTEVKQRASFGRFSPDGKQIAFLMHKDPKNKGPVIAVRDLATPNAEPTVVSILNGEIEGFCWSPDGKRIAYTWREKHEGEEPSKQIETEFHLVVVNRDGSGLVNLRSQKGPSQYSRTLGFLEWR